MNTEIYFKIQIENDMKYSEEELKQVIKRFLLNKIPDIQDFKNNNISIWKDKDFELFHEKGNTYVLYLWKKNIVNNWNFK